MAQALPVAEHHRAIRVSPQEHLEDMVTALDLVYQTGTLLACLSDQPPLDLYHHLPRENRRLRSSEETTEGTACPMALERGCPAKKNYSIVSHLHDYTIISQRHGSQPRVPTSRHLDFARKDPDLVLRIISQALHSFRDGLG